MKNCRNIRGDLSAYIDGELTTTRRTEVSSHLETCTRCQQELSELQKLTAGVTALPRLQPAPRFLTEVRRKIAKGEDPEATNWLDAVFQPFWLKVPLEIAALVLIVGLVMRVEHPATIQPVGNREVASEADNDNNRPDAGPQNEDAKAVANEAKLTASEPVPALEEAKKESPQAPALEQSEQKAALAAESRSVASNESAPQSTINNSTVGGGNSAGSGGQRAASPRRSIVVAGNESSYSPSSATAPALGLFQSVSPTAPLKSHEQVTLQSRDFGAVRNRAQELATKCNGKVLLASQSTDGAGRVLFVEVPREYAAAFKVELSKTSTNSVAQGSTIEGLETTNFAGTSQGGGMGGVLTGTAATNVVTGDAASVTGNQEAPAPTVILEIHVVEPAN